MPTIEKMGGMRVVIYPNDHRPAHVHVMGKGCEAVFHLHCPNGPPELRENFGFSRAEVGRVRTQLWARIQRLCIRWGDIHERSAG